MKQTGFAKLITCGVALLALSFVTNVQADTRQANAKVRAIRGTAEVSVDGGGWTSLKVNETLKSGAYVRTGADSTVDLFLNNSVVRVTPETTMGIDKLLIDNTGVENVTETQLNLRSGRILGNVKKLASTSRYEVKTPNGVAGIRGTDFEVIVTPLGNGKVRLQISSISGTIVGSAVNQKGELKTAVINTGESWDPDIEGINLLPADVQTALRGIITEMQSGGVVQPATVTVGETIIYIDPVTSPTEGTSPTE